METKGVKDSATRFYEICSGRIRPELTVDRSFSQL